jgi:hypothetical protein
MEHATRLLRLVLSSVLSRVTPIASLPYTGILPGPCRRYQPDLAVGVVSFTVLVQGLVWDS